MADPQDLPTLEVASCRWYDVLGKSLGKLWEEQIGCDFTFVCRGGKELRAHSCILQAVSLIIKQWMASFWTSKDYVYHMELINSETLMLVLRFIYHGKFTVPESARLQEVKSLAESLKIDELVLAFSDHSGPRENMTLGENSPAQTGNFIWPHKKARKYKMLGVKEKGLEEGFPQAMDPDGAAATAPATDAVGSHNLLPPPSHPSHPSSMMGPVFPNAQPLPFGTPGHSAFAIPPRPPGTHSLAVNLSNQRESGIQVDTGHRMPMKSATGSNHAPNMGQQGMGQQASGYSGLNVNQGPAQETLPSSSSQASLVLYVGEPNTANPQQQALDGSTLLRNLPPSNNLTNTAVTRPLVTQTNSRVPDTSFHEMRDLWNTVDLNFGQQQMTNEDLNALSDMPASVDMAAHQVPAGKTKRRKSVGAKDVVAKDKQAKKKRTSRPETWKKNIRKLRKARGLAYISSKGKLMEGKSRRGPPCNCRMRCHEKITEEECNEIFVSYFALGDKNMQDAVLFGLVEREDTKRKKTKDVVRQRSNTFLYYVRKKDGMVINVCREAFKSVYGVTCKCLRRLQEHVARGNIAPPVDMRGKCVKRKSDQPNENIAPPAQKSKPDQIPLPQEYPT